MKMAHFHLFLVLFFLCLFVNPSCQQQLQSAHTQVLLQLRKQLEFPKQLDAWNYTKDLCSVPPTPSLSITCEQNSVTELKIVGDRLVKGTKFGGHPVPGQTLSEIFSVDSFVTTLTRLTSLRVVILVSLGIWGPLPDKIHRLYALEVLDLSSNYLYGSIPPKISAMGMLQTLTMDGNFFNDTVPDFFDALSNLTVLSLKSNQLVGELPRSLGGVRTLTSLALSSNSISGSLPDLSGLRNLEVLDLRENEIESELPPLPTGLVTLLLSKNSLSGAIPESIGELKQLQHLDMSFNLLRGTPPASLFSLPNLTYLNLASNMLSGSLPRELTCSSNLGFVDISTNRLTGDLPSCLNGNSNRRFVKFAGNCLFVDPKHQHEAEFCKVPDSGGGSAKSKKVGVLVAIFGGLTILLLLALLVFLILCRRHCQRVMAEQRLLQKPAPDSSPTGLATELLTNARLISHAQKMGTQVLPTYRVFSLEELQDATDNFNESKYVGEGSTGKLYKGKLENGTNVAIRCLSFFKRCPIRNLKLRLDLLAKLRHPNLVCLLGHCIDSMADDCSVNKVYLVYEYVPNGDLRLHLSESCLERALMWPDRLSVLIGIAKAVHFLHTGIIPGFYNNRLKTRNILLDEHYIAKLSDYGLSIITEEIDRNEIRVDGQKSYYATQNKSSTWEAASLEDDVYTFGFILLEALVGPSIIEKGEAFFLTEMATLSSNPEELKKILDPVVMSTSAQESLSIIVSITNKCVSPDPSFRPSIEDVLWNLQYASQVQATADGDQKSDVTSQA